MIKVKIPLILGFLKYMPVSSRNSRIHESRTDSPGSIFPPGATHQLRRGFCKSNILLSFSKTQFVTRCTTITPIYHYGSSHSIVSQVGKLTYVQKAIRSQIEVPFIILFFRSSNNG